MNDDFAAARTNMVDSQVRPLDVPDISIQDAMRSIRREDFVPAAKRALAYADAELEYSAGRWLLRPRDVAKLIHALAPRAGETALAISAPYAGAVLQRIGLDVASCDAAGPLPAREGGWRVIICEGSVSKAPQAWVDALAPGGRLGVVERDSVLGRAMVYLRGPAAVGARPVFDSTPPLLAGFERPVSFVF
ncbi:MAG TPA: protein-L-isoaspartate O-methyltransferase [Caulobacteraceae bacterium]|jgi:protein-L-isoaspartate(D-aspartate) O-methyltransferase|nr:protein-L-isoaspartate O-methyltransferase [Caulobacteraceae bacterium]